MRRIALIFAAAGLAVTFAACTAAPGGHPTATAGIGTATPAVTIRSTGGALESPQLPSEAAELRGTWDHVLDEEGRDFVLENFAGLVDSADEVVTRFGFDGDDWWQGFLFDGELFLLHGVPEGSGGTFTVDQDVLVMHDAGGEVRIAYEWVIDRDSLSLTAVEECWVASGETSCTNDQSEMEQLMLLVTNQTFTRSGDDPSYSQATAEPTQARASATATPMTSS
jgi:hypothetical protein